MKLEEIHPVMREALCAFHILRRLGFPADDIFFHLNAGFDDSMVVVLRTQDKEFAIGVGVCTMEYQDWQKTWFEVVEAARGNRISLEDQARMWHESFLRMAPLEMLKASIESKGIRIYERGSN